MELSRLFRNLPAMELPIDTYGVVYCHTGQIVEYNTLLMEFRANIMLMKVRHSPDIH